MMNKIIYVIKRTLPVCVKIFLARALVALGYAREFKKSWLVCERGDDARDNGYFFFRYLRTQHNEILCHYIISPGSADFQKITQLGETLIYGSFRHYAAILQSKCLISSHIMGFSPDPEVFMFLQSKYFFKLPGKQIFLQHGIIKANIEGLKHPHIQVDLFVCGAKAEYQYILQNYRHPKGVVQFTGLARYDTLCNQELKNQILLMPTWRKWLNALTDEQFMASDYYKAYHEILSDTELLRWLDAGGFKILFYPHYEMQKFIQLFQPLECDCIQICNHENADIQTLLRQSKLLITDYSSVYFDFAYLKKPIIYYQFDQTRFFHDHYKKGYFNENEFGIVVYNFCELEAKLMSLFDGINFMNPYINTQKEFFGGLNGGCCDRIFSKIEGLLE